MTTRSTTPSATSRSPIDALVKLVLRNTIRNPLRFVGLILLGYIAFIALSNIIDGDYTLELFVRQLIFGLSQGSIYALIALGYTLVYGILFMINFAHGEVFMAGAYFGFFALYAMGESGLLQSQTALALILAVVIGALGSAVVAVLLERIAYRPLRSAPRLVPLITAIGASITLQQLFLRLFGASARRYPDVSLYVLPDVFKTLECSVIEGVEVCRGMDLIRGLYTVDVLGLTLRLRPITFIVFFISLALMGALWFIIQRTKTGRAMRAVAEDASVPVEAGENTYHVNVDVSFEILQ